MLEYAELVADLVRQDYAARFDAAVVRRNLAHSKRFAYPAAGVVLLLVLAFASVGTRTSEMALAVAVVWMVAWLVALALVLRAWNELHRLDAPRDLGARGVLLCDGCGKKQIVDPGRAEIECTHCHARLLVPRRLAGALAEHALVSAEKSAQARRDALASGETAGSGLGMGFVLFAVVFAAIVGIVYTNRSDSVKVAAGLVWVGMAMTGIPAALVMASARRRARQPFEDLTESLVRRARVLPREDRSELIVFSEPVEEDALP